MKQICHILVSILLCCIFVPCTLAQENEVEIQLGAFKLKSAAQKYVDEIATQIRRPIYISPLQNAGGKSFYTVRTGPFDSADKARSFIENADPDFSATVWIMYRNSMQPAMARQFSLGTSSGASSNQQMGFSLAAQAASPDSEASSQQEPETGDPAPEGGGGDESDSQGAWGTGDNTDNAEQKTDTGASAGSSSNQEIERLREQVNELQEQVKTLLEAEEVRSALEGGEEEEREKEEDVLSAAGRQYTLLQKDKLGLEYKIEYGYYPYDQLREQGIIEHAANHSITNTFTLEYPLKNNLTLQTDIPFVYKYDRVGADNSKNVSDFGDVDFGVNYQPIKSGGGFPSIILRTTLTTPMGRSPYDINPDTELSTGSGGYAIKGTMSVSKSVDPVMVFGSLGYKYKFPIRDLDYKLQSGYTLERYERGNSIEVSMGLGYSLSYNTSLTLGYSYTYTLEAKRYFKEAEPRTSPTRASSSISIGTSWRISPKFRLNMQLGIDITDANYHSISFRFPFEFNL
ncbi:MAG: SPOR domain-containing protein [Desulfobacteraceae bacterium]|nr:SPOR domain-containing protein [Desulfobacteraceae bacterium]